MKPAVRIVFSRIYWRNLERGRFFKAAFAAVGVIATLVALAKKLVEAIYPGNVSFSDFPSEHWVISLVLIFIAALIKGVSEVWPVTSLKSQIKQRDLAIKIEIGDIFQSSETLIVGTNRTFDTDIESGLISKKSVQGQYTERNYKNVQHLDAEIASALEGATFETIGPEQKKKGKQNEFPIGTVARIGDHGMPALFVAVAKLNSHGVANATIDDLRTCLSALWQFIGERGGGLPCLRTPIIGSGFSKIAAPRQALAKEILRSFVTACVEAKFCDRLTLVISVQDYLDGHINLQELGDYLRYLTTYTEIRSANEVGAGTKLAA